MNSTLEIAEGLMILAKYPNCDTSAEHDVILSGPNDPETVSDEDKKRLTELTWFISGEYGCWAVFT
jgi:hypothetical protein